MTYADAASLTGQTLAEADVDVPGKGKVRVRALSRADVLDLRGSDQADVDFEARMLALALVAPAMTPDEVGVWLRSAPTGQVEPVIAKVNRLAGFAREDAKAAWLEMASEGDAEFRDGTSAGAGHDAGPAAG